MADVNKEKMKALQLAMDKLEKTYGKGAVMKLGDEATEQIEVIPSGSIGLDLALGIQGYPKGRIVEIYGPESSGKTTLAIHAIAECQKAGGICAIIDAEHAFDKFYAEALGVDTKIGVMFGNPETTTGGNALKFYSSIRIDIRRATQLKEGEDIIGNRVKVKVVKNKVAPPFRKAEFDIMYGEGISKVGEIIDLGVDLNILKKSGSWFSYGETKLGQGRDAIKSLILDNPELMEELEEKIKNALATPNGQAEVLQD